MQLSGIDHAVVNGPSNVPILFVSTTAIALKGK